jgi:hypothetical protein
MKALSSGSLANEASIGADRQMRGHNLRTQAVQITPEHDKRIQLKSHCACGGGCPRCKTERDQPGVMPISQPGDAYEREADDVAERVMRMAEPPEIASAPSAIQRKFAECEDEEQTAIQTKRAPLRNAEAVLDPGAAERGGAPLPTEVRSYFEPRFGHDFSRVRVHTDARAAESARSLSARAYTIGSDVIFGAGQFVPATQGGRRLLAHELTHTIQQSSSANASNGLSIAREPVDKLAEETAKKEPEKKEPEKKEAEKKEPAKDKPETKFGSPRVAWDIFDDLVLKLPQRWQAAYKVGKQTGDDILFDPQLGRDLAYRQLMAVNNMFYANVFTGMSAYKPTFSKGLDMAESLSGVTDTYLNLLSMGLHLDLKKYLETDLSDRAMSNLGWTVIYGLAVQGALTSINAAGKEDLDFLSLLSKPLKRFTDAPRDFARPYQLGNIPDPRWTSNTFGSSPTGFGAKLSGWSDPTKATTLSMNLGFNIASAASLYPEKEADKAKYRGFELYPYGSFSVPVKDATSPPVLDPNAPVTPLQARSKWMAGVFIGKDGFYTLVEGGEKLGLDNKVMETYSRAALFARDLGPFTMIQASGEISNRVDDPAVLRGRLNAATTIKLVDNSSWQAIVGGSVGYLLPSGASAGGFDYGGQVSLYNKYQRGGGLDPMKTGIDLGLTYRQQDPFNMAAPDLLGIKGTLSIFDVVKISVQYNQITGETLDNALPKSDFIFMISPGPAIFPFSKK